MKRKVLAVCSFLILLIGLFFFSIPKKEKNWQFLVENKIGAESILNIGKSLSFDEKNLYFSDGLGNIHSLNKKTGQLNWQKKLPAHSPYQISLNENRLYIASFNSHIYCLDKNNGSIVWTYTIPNLFWPDTAIYFDQNDKNLFFADRAGILYALNKQTGQETWKKELGSIDNTQKFIEKTIHFGFIQQNDQHLLIKHFPTQKLYSVDKKTGEILLEKTSQFLIEKAEIKTFFAFDKFDLFIEDNVAAQPLFSCLDKDKNLIWQYQSPIKIEQREIYSSDNWLYYLDTNRQLLTAIEINEQVPTQRSFKKINFKIIEDYSSHEPFPENANPQLDYVIKNLHIKNWLKEKNNQFKYFLKNFKDFFDFQINFTEQNNYLECQISHQENFYQNLFNALKIEGTFTHQDGETIKVRGFYFDRNTWQLRSRLKKGDWDWQIKISNRVFSKKFSGQLKVTKDFPSSLRIKGDSFLSEDESVFFPIGLQGTIEDLNVDGNPLNQMDYAKSLIPTNNPSEYQFLDFANYLDLYQKEAQINIFRYGPNNWAPAIWQNLANPKSFAMEINGNHYADSVFNELKDRNLKIVFSIFSFYPPHSSKTAIKKISNRQVLKKYLDYVIARYASIIDVWELSNEALPNQEWQDFVSDYLAKHDPYQHPITISLENINLKNSQLLSIHHYTPTPKNNLEIVEQVNKLKNQESWQQAVLLSEFGFQESNYFLNSSEIMRKFAWISTFEKIGLIFWNSGKGLFQNPDHSNIYLGPQEREYLANLGNFLPTLSYPLKNKSQVDHENHLAIYELSDQNYQLYYLLQLTEEKNEAQTLSLELERAGQIEIFDPEKGFNIESWAISESQDKIILPIFTEDLAIKITYN